MNRITASALVLGVAVVMGSASDAKAFFGLLGGGCGGCCEPTCGMEPTCGCEPMCCDPCCEPRHRGCCLFDGLKGMFKRRSHCCDPCCEPSCCAEPTCCAQPTCCAEPSCGCEPVCCDPCCEPRHRGCCLLDGLRGLFKRRSHCGDTCCCEPVCEPTCGCEPSCGCGY